MPNLRLPISSGSDQEGQRWPITVSPGEELRGFFPFSKKRELEYKSRADLEIIALIEGTKVERISDIRNKYRVDDQKMFHF